MKEDNPDEIEEMGSIMVGDNITMDLIYECETKRVQKLEIFQDDPPTEDEEGESELEEDVASNEAPGDEGDEERKHDDEKDNWEDSKWTDPR